ncbi:PaaI family thioesterase [Nocardia sp. NPDC003482]
MDHDTVRVPWSVVPDYRCFGCSPHNPSGLRLSFTRRGDGLEAAVRLGREFESYPGVVHGGLIGVVCDEVMGNLIVLARGVPAFTVSMRTRYLTPLLVDGDYVCRATISEGGDATIAAAAEIVDADGQLCATATATYRPFALGDVRHQLTLSDDDVARLSDALSRPNTLSPNGVHP